MDDNLIKVEVAYARPEQQTLLALSVAKNSKLLEVIKLSGILSQHPEINITESAIGIFGKKLTHPEDYQLQAGDRIEIYRPLLADPKEVRRLRAERAANKKV